MTSKPKRRSLRGHEKRYCDDCDGCGWVEGGAALQTPCKTCEGEGVVLCRTPAKPTPKPRKARRVVLGHGEPGMPISAWSHTARCAELTTTAGAVALKGLGHIGERGTLIWEPDPPKAKR